MDSLKKYLQGNPNIEKLSVHSLPVIVGFPYDLGMTGQRGASLGPRFIRDNIDLQKALDLGDINGISQLFLDEYLAEKPLKTFRKCLYKKDCQLPVSPLSILREFCERFFLAWPDKNMLLLGGDQTASLVCIQQWFSAMKVHGHRPMILHFDGLSDNSALPLVSADSWVYHLLPNLDSSDQLIQVGPSADSVDLAKIISLIQRQNSDSLYISIDVSFLNSTFMQSVGTPNPNGRSLHELVFLLRSIKEKFPIRGADIMEYSPHTSHFSPNPKAPAEFTSLQSVKVLMETLIEVLN